MAREEVKQLQMRLNKEGVTDSRDPQLVVDGKLGIRTRQDINKQNKSMLLYPQR